MGQFDQTARPLAKKDGASFFGWALSCVKPTPRWTFGSWDDTRRLVCPGEPDRTNDLVALLRDEDRPSRPLWLITEIEDEPEPGIFYRTAQYEVLLGKEVNPTCSPDGPAVVSLVLNLSGVQRPARLDWTWGEFGTRLAPLIVNVAEEDAGATLERIERGELGLTVLPFLALMIGGGTPEFIERWKTAVEREPEPSGRIAIRDSALILSELTPRQVNWLRGTEGWMARESTLIKGWLNEGREDGKLIKARADLLKTIQLRLQDPVPEPIRLAIEGTNDLATLDLWFETALTTRSLAKLRRVMKLDP
jgi:hypothetical protein